MHYFVVAAAVFCFVFCFVLFFNMQSSLHRLMELLILGLVETKLMFFEMLTHVTVSAQDDPVCWRMCRKFYIHNIYQLSVCLYILPKQRTSKQASK